MAEKIIVLTNEPLKKVLGRPDVARWLVGWAIELGKHDIEYWPKAVIKGQAVMDFTAETTVPIVIGRESTLKDILEWTLYVDGSSMEKRNVAKIMLVTP